MVQQKSPTWEYQDLSLEYDGSWAEELDKLGKEGWQVILAIHDESVSGDKELRVLLMRPVNATVTVDVSVGGRAKREGRVTKRKSKTASTGHEVVDQDEESDEDAP